MSLTKEEYVAALCGMGERSAQIVVDNIFDLEANLAAITKERDELKASFQLRVIELHIEQNGSGLPLKGYDDCSRHTFETCTSPKCITAREILVSTRKETTNE